MEQIQLEKILNSIQKIKIAVIGDFCLDAYWEIDDTASEISLETGLATKPVRSQKYSPGGASNVVANLIDIGAAEVRAFGVLGKDIFGKELLRIFQNLGVNISGICVQENNWSTQVFLKPIKDGKELNRFDMGNFNDLSEQTADDLIQKIKNSINEIDIVIINQQALKSIHSKYFRERLVKVIAANPEKQFITDSRTFSDEFSGTIRKINEFEVMRFSGFNVRPGEAIEKDRIKHAAETLSKKWNTPMFVTTGEAGTLICENKKIEEIPAIKFSGEVDTVGAGDSFLAASASALAIGAGMKEAAELGNLAAGVTVQKLLCTGTASPEEIVFLNRAIIKKINSSAEFNR